MFLVTGVKDGQSYSVRMRNGKLSGDDYMLAILKRENDIDHGFLGLQPNTESKGRYLSSELSAGHLASICFDSVVSFENDWNDDVPEGSIF